MDDIWAVEQPELVFELLSFLVVFLLEVRQQPGAFLFDNQHDPVVDHAHKDDKECFLLESLELSDLLVELYDLINCAG